MEIQESIKLPAIASDIDGVLFRGKQVLGNSTQVLQEKILNQKTQQNVKIPFVLLTNGGGLKEADKANDINKKLNLVIEPMIKEDYMIECHTPLKNKDLLEKYGDKYVLIYGSQDSLEVAISYGYSQSVELTELVAIYPNACPLEINTIPKDKIETLRSNLVKRFGMSIEELQRELKFAAIFQMSHIDNQGIGLQIASDLISSKDGHLLGGKRTINDPQTVTLIGTNPDLVYVSDWPFPRYGPAVLFHSLSIMLDKMYKLKLEYSYFGKPEKATFDYAESILKQQAISQGIEITNYYMIGDNPNSDIKGANQKGWVSILVRTGVFQGEENSQENPAKYVVKDFQEAIELVFQLENLQL